MKKFQVCQRARARARGDSTVTAPRLRRFSEKVSKMRFSDSGDPYFVLFWNAKMCFLSIL